MAEKVASDFQVETLCGQLVAVTSQVVTSVAEIEEDLFLPFSLSVIIIIIL